MTEVVIVGAGARGTGVLAALASAGLPAGARVTVVERCGRRTGGAWSESQALSALANTEAATMTLVEPDDGVGTFAAWLARTEDAQRFVSPLGTPRRLVGHYIRSVFDSAVRVAAFPVRRVEEEVVEVVTQPALAVLLAGGGRINAEAVVLCCGVDDRGCRALSATGVEVEVETIPAGARVVARGMGLTFHDVIARLTCDRGGSFDESGGGSRLRYRPNGDEPLVLATSPSGLPRFPRLLDSESHFRVDGGLDAAAFVRESRTAAQARTALLRLIAANLALQGLDIDDAGWPSGLAQTGHQGIAQALSTLAMAIRTPDGASHAARAQGSAVATLRALLPGVDSRAEDHPEQYAHALGAMEEVGAQLSSGPLRRRILELDALVAAGIIRFVGALGGPEAQMAERDADYLMDTRVRARPLSAILPTRAGWRFDAGGRLLVSAEDFSARAPGVDGDRSGRVFAIGAHTSVGHLPTLPRVGEDPAFFAQNRRLAAAVVRSLNRARLHNRHGGSTLATEGAE